MDRPRICRILDANFNRAGEALREIEDAARFGLNSSWLSARAKEVRHRLGAAPALLGLSPLELAAARDAQGDVGRPAENSITTSRQSSADVLVAAFKRLEQALRSLEEYSKLLSTAADPGFEAMRYAVYSLEKDYQLRLQPKAKLEGARLYLLLIGDVLLGRDHESALQAAIEGGIDMVQVREKEMSDRDFFKLAARLRAICEQAGILCLINDRVDVARGVDADGVHLGEEDLPLAAAREVLGADKILGATSHTLEEALQGQNGGADYLGFGTMFPTDTKRGLTIRGTEEINKLRGRIEIPVFAIGGITLENLPELLARGVHRVAVSGAILRSPDIRRAAAEFKKQLLESSP